MWTQRRFKCLSCKWATRRPVCNIVLMKVSLNEPVFWQAINKSRSCVCCLQLSGKSCPFTPWKFSNSQHFHQTILWSCFLFFPKSCDILWLKKTPPDFNTKASTKQKKILCISAHSSRFYGVKSASPPDFHLLKSVSHLCFTHLWRKANYYYYCKPIFNQGA